MCAMAPKLLGIPLAGNTDYEAEAPCRPGLHTRKGVLDDNRSRGLNAEQLCRHQKRIRGRFPCQVLSVDRVAIYLRVEDMIQLGGPQNHRAILARSDDGDFEPAIAELVDEPDTALVGLNSFFFYDFVDQVVLGVPEAVHCLDLRRIVGASLGELDTARCEKVADAVIAGLTIHVEQIVSGDIEGMKYFTSLYRSLLEVLVEHLFPTR